MKKTVHVSLVAHAEVVNLTWHSKDVRHLEISTELSTCNGRYQMQNISDGREDVDKAGQKI